MIEENHHKGDLILFTIYPTLYSLDSTGKIRTWNMEQDGPLYRTISGVDGGQLVTSEWTEAKEKNIGKKNATTATDQATKEINAKYKKQLKTGYFEDKNSVGEMSYIEPILAKQYKDYSHKLDLSSGNYLMQTKFNGMRCIATRDGLFTRKGEKYLTCVHIEEDLKEFFEIFPQAVLDGELFNMDLKQQLNEISKLIRKTVHITMEDLLSSRKLVQFYIYDGYNFVELMSDNTDLNYNKDTPYYLRKDFIDREFGDPDYKHIRLVEDFPVTSKEQLMDKYSELVDFGHEGAMLRLKTMPYEHKRSKNLLKIKPEDSDDAVIINIQEGTGNWSGTGKIITLNWNGTVFDATLKGSQEQGRDFLANKSKWIGATVEFLYNGLTGLGTPNFARVDYNNCLKGDR
jgi:DNA ligase-1